jgi:hypothetical protein
MILFFGCEDKTFSRIYDKKAIGEKITYIAVSESNLTIKNMAIEALLNEGFSVKVGSAYVLEVEGSHYPKKCNNPNTSTYDATYDGYIKLTLLKNMKPLYMCQQDYHGVVNTNIIEHLIKKMQEELKLP